MDSAFLSLALTPHGRLVFTPDPDAPSLDTSLQDRLLQPFDRRSGHGLLSLGAGEAGTSLPPVLSYWREFGTRYVIALCTHQPGDDPRRKVPVAAPSDEELERILLAAPPMTGAEYLTVQVLRSLWDELDKAFDLEISEC